MSDGGGTPHDEGNVIATPISDRVRQASPSTESPGRSVKRQKVTRACDRCKARKRRCNGEMPCAVCQSVGSYCTYNASYTRGKVVGPLPSSNAQVYSRPLTQRSPRAESNESEDAVASFGGQYLGPTSAYSFLRRAWERFGKERDGAAEQGDDIGRAVSVFAYGDRRMLPVSGDGSKLPDRSATAGLVEIYFDYAMPTYRFFHRPSVLSWLADYHSGSQMSPVRQAIVLMVLATASLFIAVRGFARLDSDEEALQDAERFYQAARRIVSEETGRAKLESVQARLAVCLYLLHTSRPNQAWYTFGTTVQMIFALGLHRKQHESHKLQDAVVVECRRRSFWAAATLDTYLSIMLGRPSLLHEDDIDQEHPRPVHDEDMSLTDDTKGDAAVEASILHAKIGSILKKASYEQYSMNRKTNPRRTDQTARLNADLAAWKASLPVVLSGAVHTANLVPVFRRQVVVLRLAHAHAVMFINRPLLLSDVNPIESADPHVQACLTAARDTLESLLRAVHDGTAFNAFWFTQYVTFSALSIVYVWLIQRRRGRLTACGVPYEDNQLLQLAEEIQEHLAKATQTNAPSLRYSAVLSELQQEARLLVTGVGPTPPLVDHSLAATTTTGHVASVASTLTATGANVPPTDAAADPLGWETLSKDLPLDPDLWLQLDAFPFSDIGFDEWTSPT